MSDYTIPKEVSPVDVASIVEQVMKSMVPLIGQAVQAARPTPEELNEMKKPYLDPTKEATNLRLRRMTQNEISKALRDKKERQDNCSHTITAPGGITSSSINTVGNFPDGQWRGLCGRCEKWIQPPHWEIDYDANNPEGRPRFVEADPEYGKVIDLINAQVSGNNYF